MAENLQIVTLWVLNVAILSIKTLFLLLFGLLCDFEAK